MNPASNAEIGEPALRRAAALFRAGDLTAAGRLCQGVLDAAPDDPDALHLLAVIDLQRGFFHEADHLVARWLQVEPGSAAAHASRAAAQHGLKRPEEALASYDRALALRPGFALALYNRGVVLQELGRHEAAAASYDAALAARPDYAEALNNRGVALHALKRHAAALASLDRALILRPGYGDALINRAAALRSLKRHEEALAGYDAALAAMPGNAGALLGRAMVLRTLNRQEEALAGYDASLAIEPGSVETLNNRGIVLQDLHRYEEALASFDRALALRPGQAELLNNRGVVLHAAKRHAEALASFAHGLAAEPDHVELLKSRAATLAALGRHEEAAADLQDALRRDPDQLPVRAGLLHHRMIGCDWSSIGREAAPIVAGIRAGRVAGGPFALLGFVPDPADLRLHAGNYVAESYPRSSPPVWRGERYDHDRIRVAYLSPDFDDHPVAHLIARLIEAHDRSRFEIIAISFGAEAGNAMRARLERAFERFIDVRGKGDREVARLLRALEIDIAVDLAGFTGDCRPGILALRPAPVQVAFLGYPGTMGGPHMDYIIADRIVIPAHQQPHYAEHVVQMPDSYMPSDPGWPIAEPGPTRRDAGLPEAAFVFCSFNNHYKINPGMFDIWMRLLGEVEDSVMWLSAASGPVARNLRREAADRGIAPDRLVFAPRLDLADHFARHRLADLFLDTLPFGAHTTAINALWAGLPVLTCLGAGFAGRVAASLLHAVGLPELVTPSPAAYESLARALARDRPALAAVRAKLARQRATAPLFDADRFRRHIESAYRMMWLRQQSGEPPSGFAVAPST